MSSFAHSLRDMRSPQEGYGYVLDSWKESMWEVLGKLITCVSICSLPTLFGHGLNLYT